MISILIVDDEGPIRDWIAYCIEQEHNLDFNLVATARNGIEGVSLAQEHHPDLVITDIMMPGMDGLEMMKTILKTLPYTNFIILSNYAEFSYARTALAYGAKHYLLKSELRASDLVATIKTIHQAKIDLLSGKMTDMYANGFLDIYDIYQKAEDLEFARSFMLRHGMKDNMAYCVLSLMETNLFAQRQLIDTLLEQLQIRFSLAALQKHTILLIIQEHSCSDLMNKAHQFGQLMCETSAQHVGIGHIQNNLKAILKAVNEAEQLVLARFFYPDTKLLTTPFFHSFPALDRQHLWKTSLEVFDALQIHDCHKTLQILNPWLQSFSRVRLEDIQWAKETCLRMVFTLEERVSHTVSKEEKSIIDEIDEPQNFGQCKRRILHSLKSLDEHLSDTYTERIHKARNYIHEHFQNQISLVEVADHVGLSSEYFSRLFKDKSGENFTVYLMMLRLQEAHKRLKETQDKISDIARDVGYASPSYFTKLYKKYMGVNPEDVRKKQEMSK